MMAPPPTPNSALNAPAAVAMTASRASRDDIPGHTTCGVWADGRPGKREPPAADDEPPAERHLLRHRRHAGADRRASRAGPRAGGDLEAARAPGPALRLRRLRPRPVGGGGPTAGWRRQHRLRRLPRRRAARARLIDAAARSRLQELGRACTTLRRGGGDDRVATA